jgi:hypothetical protein
VNTTESNGVRTESNDGGNEFFNSLPMSQWLIMVPWVAVILGLFALAFDVTAHPQHMKIMNVAWPFIGKIPQSMVVSALRTASADPSRHDCADRETASTRGDERCRQT